MTALPGSMLLVGAGKMGGALLQGWLDEGMDPAAMAIVDPRPSGELLALARRHGLAVGERPPSGAAFEAVVLAVKPQMLDAVAPALCGAGLADALLVSILAGKTVGDLAARLPFRSVVRAMPNTPAAVRRGSTGLFANAATTPAQRVMAEATFACVGVVEWLDDEALIDAVTAVSGSGPAYFFLFVDCLAEAGAAIGLDRAQAERLARATMIGAARLMEAEPGTGPDQLRRNVTSPGGTTAAALDVFGDHRALSTLVAGAVRAARDRAVALSG